MSEDSSMRVLVADRVAQAGLDVLKEAGIAVRLKPNLQGKELFNALAESKPHVLVVRSTTVTARMLDASPHLELIVRAGAGYDTIDVAAASTRGIYVANCPGKNAVAVAELTMGLLLSLDRRIPDNVAEARRGRWNKIKFAQAEGLKGRTFGIIGMGNIGHEVAQRALAFGMEVIVWSRSLTTEEAESVGARKADSPQSLASEVDAVSLHVASTSETRHLADRGFFEAMRPGAFFINTTRSDVVDEDALAWAMDEKGIRAAVDVLSAEPSYKEGEYQHPLADYSNLYISHHIGASTQQAQDATAREAARVICTYKNEARVPNCVNLAQNIPGMHQLSVRHLDKVGVLAFILDEIRKAEWNVQEMENQIFDGGEAACAHIRFDGSPHSDIVNAISDHEDVLAVTLLS